MTTPGAGHQFPAVPVSWLTRELLLFANSIGCEADELHFLYELHPNFTAFPTYPVVLQFKHTDVEVVDFHARAASSAGPGGIPGVPALDTRRVVDGERRIEFRKPLPATTAGRRFELRTTVLGVYDKGKPGTVVETEQSLVDAESGDVYTRVVGSSFYIGQGGWGGPKGPATASFPPPPNTPPTATHVQRTTAESALLYRLSGDYNPLHADPSPGRRLGFGGAIMHGLYSWNAACHALLRGLAASDPARIRDFQARFASPVRPGDALVTEMWRTGEVDGEGWEEVRFVTTVEGGKVCLTNGRASVKCVGSPKSKL